MKRKDVLRMAREAGIPEFEEIFSANSDDLGRFAAAVRAATKEEDARICDSLSNGFHSPHEYSGDCAEAIRASK